MKPKPTVGLLFALALLPVEANAEGAGELAPHRAVYDLGLERASDGSGVAALTGRIVVEMTGSRCEGFVMNFRQVTRIETSEGQSRLTDARSMTFETADGDAFDFLNQVFLNEARSQNTRGRATRDEAGKVAVKLSEPAENTLALSCKTLFPTAHLERLLSAARAGEGVVETDVYDGSDGGDKVYKTTAIIGEKRVETAPDDEAAANVAPLAGMPVWPVTVSYFDKSEKTGEITPTFEFSFLLYDNGVNRRLTLDYGDFSMTGRLTAIEFLPVSKCDE